MQSYVRRGKVSIQHFSHYFLEKSFQKKKKSRKGHPPPFRLVPDPSYLAFTYHRAIFAALCLTPSILHKGGGGGGGGGGGVGARVLIIGLGGGALPTFFQRYLPQVRLSPY